MPKRRRGLSPEEQALWNRVAEAVHPLGPERKQGTPLLQPSEPKSPPKSLTPTEVPPFRIGERKKASASSVQTVPSISDHLAAQPLNMDQKKFRRMQRGKLEPEARIDLHGQTLASAHPALIGFIMRSAAEGLRLVLVITGKGKTKDDGGPIPVRHGVLKNQVPDWLRRPPCAALVLEVREAHQNHGGGGAYYVYLRRNR
ncbi:MAG: Smr/MutS family protein [Pseudomonadota bacterium]